MKSTLNMLTMVVVLLAVTFGLRNLVMAATPATAHMTALANGTGGPVPPQNFMNGTGGPVPPQNFKNGTGGPVPPQNFMNGTGGPVPPQN